MTITITTDITERRDASTEAWLEANGVRSATLRMFPLAEADLEASLKNQARLHEPLTEQWVDDYTRALGAGAVFPPIVITPKGIIAEGNHRTHAHKRAGRDEIAAYVVDVPHAVFRLLAATANTTIGHPATPDEVAAHAVYLNDTGAMSFTQIASALNIGPSLVADIVHAETARRRIGRVAVTKKLSRTNLAMLDQIVSDTHLAEAARAAAEAPMGQKVVRKMVNDVKKARNSDQALAAIRSAEDQVSTAAKEAKKPKSAAKPDDVGRFMRGAGLVLSVNPTALALAANGSADSLLERARELVRQLAEIEKAVSS
jgi:ParB-like chromosome segregation protein Spo0J